jgi:hypothetical protein
MFAVTYHQDEKKKVVLLSVNGIYREFRERRTRLTLLLSASACKTPVSSAEKNYCCLALDMPCIVNMYVHI